MYYTNQIHRFYLLCLILTSAAFTGCNVIPGPTPTPTPVEIKTPPSNADDDQAILAISIADTLGNTAPDIIPTPSPNTVKVGDVCPVCEGRGKSGDGIQPCGPCRGDGRVDAGDPVLSTEVVPAEEHSVVVQHARQEDFDALVEEINTTFEENDVEAKALKEAVEQSTARINELEAKVSSLVSSVDKLTATLSSQEKAQSKVIPKASSAPTGYWKTIRVKKCNGRICWYENVRTWVPYATSNPQSSTSTDSYYPTRRSLWSGCGSWKHLTQGEHRGKFDPTWLQGLSWNELQSLHSDDHEGRVKWQYVVRGS